MLKTLVLKIKENCKKYKSNKEFQKSFHYLIPTNKGEKIESYIASLKWAFSKKKYIKNIAISGPYGSGKSSVINTFIKKYPFNHKYLKISLATFKNLNSTEQTDQTELERLIELSLLQQFFYHEKDYKIPDSKFHKNHKIRKPKACLYVFLIILFLFSLAYIFPGGKVTEFIAKYIPFFDLLKELADKKELIKTFFSSYFLLFICSCIYIGIKLVSNITSMKFSIKNAEIEIGTEVSKSALNTYLDEILYFFEVSKYSVVFIEDLDRFEQSDIFVKLRELNQLINNSKKVKQNVVFVYAIKDEMFMNKERTKFFDFIIPVIPVINNSNSKEKLQTILKKSNYEISQDLISNISIFIDDMRLLYNILNEFYLYERTLDKSTLKTDNLLAIITYKNLFPSDFVDLMHNKGVLYDVINKRSEYIEKKRLEIDNKIQDIQKKIEEANKISQNSLKELRLLYMGILVDLMISKGYYIQYFVDSSRAQINFDWLTQDNNFDLLKTNKLWFYRTNHGFQQIPITFTEIENKIDSQENYDTKEQKLLNKLEPQKLYNEIENLRLEKDDIQKMQLKDLLISGKLNLYDENDDPKTNECIDVLLRNGYINENYLDYISIFYEGSLKKEDYDFLLKVKRGSSTNPEDKLFSKDELIKQINKFDFEKESVLNYELIDTLLGNEFGNEKRDILFKQLSKASGKSIDFIDSFVSRTNHLETFIEQLCSNWDGIWREISSNSKFSPERKKEWFELIIKYSNIDDINHIFKENDSSISEYEDFFFITKNKERLERIISILKIKFKKINKDTEKEELDYIFDNCFYELNPTIVEFLISRKIALDESYYTSNYKFIMSSDIDSLKKYVNDSINEYITNLYLNIENNTNEELNSYIFLLNNASMKLNIKEKLIQKVETCVDDIKKIENIDVQDLLFIFNKLNVLWENVYQNYKNHEDNLSESVINYLNNYEIAKHLSTIKISNAKDDEGNGIYGNFVRSLIHEEKINDENYSFITKSSPWWYSEFDTEKLTPERISILIKNNCVNPTQTAFSYLRTNFDGKQIELFEKQPQKFTENLEELELTVNEAEKIIELDSINKKIKYSCIKQLSENDISSSIVICRFITNTFTPNSDFDFSDEIKFNLLLNEEIETSERINFFKYNHSSLDSDEISEFIKSLGKEYEEITNKHKHAEISKNEANRVLLDVLKEVGYISSKSETKNGYRVNHHTMK